MFRDCYDFGLSSVLTGYNSSDSSKENTYNPINTVSPSQLPTVPAAAWQKIVRAFANFCQYKHKLSMFHADAPRQLVLNGNLSLIDDLRKNPEDVFKQQLFRNWLLRILLTWKQIHSGMKSLITSIIQRCGHHHQSS